ncbi:MAG: hypothetical protein H6Q52_1021 [Deltaproteobacteria bacterium]|nr:hypothetical protein [Deltaproteobacteria bacterium]
MKKISLVILALLILCSCAYQDQFTRVSDAYNSTTTMSGTASRPFVSMEPETYSVRCQKMNILRVNTRQLYQDYYGTMVTSDPSSLKGYRSSYRWGITNSAPGNMQYFSAYVKPNGKFNYFRTYLYIDPGIKDSMIFLFRNNDREGEVIKKVTIEPGQTKAVDIEITGVKRLFMGSELRINHGTANRIIFGEPEFYNCKK